MKTEEAIRAEAAAEAGAANCEFGNVSDLLQQPVALLRSKNVVDQLEVFNIRADDAVVLFRMLQKLLPHLLKKEFLAVESSHPVILELIDHGGGLPQLDEAGHPMQDYLGAVRLWHIVCGPVRQS